MPTLIAWAAEIIKLGSVGLIAGYFASSRANKEFITQRWWEKKTEVYSSIIEALWKMLN